MTSGTQSYIYTQTVLSDHITFCTNLLKNGTNPKFNSMQFHFDQNLNSNDSGNILETDNLLRVRIFLFHYILYILQIVNK